MKVSIGKYKKDGTRRTKVEISKDDIFSLDYTLTLVILPCLKAYREENRGCPAYILPEKWDEIIDKMIKSFEMKIDDCGYTIDEDEEMQEGFELFGKWYQHLWI